MTTADREAGLMARLTAIHARVQWMGNPEARSAWAWSVERGDLLSAKEKLVEEAEHVLNQIERMGSGTRLS